MKKYNTLKEEITKAMQDENKKRELFERLRKTFVNEELIFETMSDKKLMHLLQYLELEKALNLKNSKYTLVHDSNFENCKAETAETNAFSYIDSVKQRALHIYSHDNTLDIVISSKQAFVNKIDIAKLKSDYKINQKRDSKKKERFKETKLSRVAFDDMINACKFALLILESTEEQLQAMLDEQ